jgi:hypothetical protein
MIPFFRKIRYKLAQDNQFLKYSRYAIGEIVLVVVGILIALYINNWNEERKDQEKLNQLFVKVQDELSRNIVMANAQIEGYRVTDSLLYKVLSKEINKEDYISNTDRSLMFLGTSYGKFNIVDDDFKSLIQFDSQMSKQEDSMFVLLKDLHTYKNAIDLENKLISDVFEDYQRKIKHQKDWYYNMFVEYEYTEEMIKYFLEDTFYINHMVDVQNYCLDNHLWRILRYRNRAISAYNELSENLSLKKDSMIVKELEDYQHYTGTYESLTATYIIKEEKDAFKITGIRKRDSLIMGDYSLIPDSKAFFTIENGYFGQLFFDKNNNVTGFRRSKGSFRRDYKKVN